MCLVWPSLRVLGRQHPVIDPFNLEQGNKLDMVSKKMNIDHFGAKSLGNFGVLGHFLYWNVKVWSFLAQYQHTPLNWINVKSFSVLQSFRVFSHLQKQEKKKNTDSHLVFKSFFHSQIVETSKRLGHLVIWPSSVH